MCSVRLAAVFCLTCRRSRRERQARENWRRCVGAATSACCAAESRTEAAPQFPEDSRVVRPASPPLLLVASSPLPQHDLLPLFYQKLFPCNDMIRYGGRAECCLRTLFVLALPADQLAGSWLSYGNDSGAPRADASFLQVRLTRGGVLRVSSGFPPSLQRREFCFTLENDVFVRYQSFKDSNELRAALMKKYAPLP